MSKPETPVSIEDSVDNNHEKQPPPKPMESRSMISSKTQLLISRLIFPPRRSAHELLGGEILELKESA